MFGWLAKMLLQTPVQNSCSCCEGKRERLEKMRRQIEQGKIEEENPQMPDDVILNCDSPEHEYSGKILGSMFSSPYNVTINGRSQSENHDEDASCNCGDDCCGKCRH